MAKVTKPIVRQPADLTADHMKAGMATLNRRITELEQFDPKSVTSRSDPQIHTLEVALDEALTSIFGADTLDYQRYQGVKHLDTAGYNLRGTPLGEVIQGLERGKKTSLALMRQIIKSFEEKLAAAGETEEGRVLLRYGGLDLHPEIDRRTGKLFEDGHYAEAVEAACKALNALVRLRSGRDDLDGAPLMRTVFSVKAPVLAFNDLADDSDRSEQEGMMHLFEGAMLAFRNPRAHKFIEDHPERALEYIQIVSTLAKALDRTE